MKYLLIIFFSLITMNSVVTQNNSITEFYDIKINSLDGTPLDLSQFKGKKLLIVNVASKCGFTGQYADLQKLYDTYHENLMVIGVPCNQFGGQEPGSASEIETFCERNYGVTFQMTEKIDVKGPNQHELYKWLTQAEYNGNKSSSVKWNFQKYLIDENGQLIDYYYSMTKPLSNKIVKHLNQ